MIIGTVPYLNVQPMVWAIEQGLVGNDVKLVPAVPSKLADMLARGECDTAIVSVFEYFRRPELYTYLDAPVIGARDEVFSVMMYSSQPWESLRRVYLDASSLTSVNLFKVLSAEKGLALEYLDTAQHAVPRPLPPGTGWVVIGDPAIAEAGKHPCSVDLGLEWHRLTGLPFVFAAWLVPEGERPRGMADLLNRSLEMGLANLEQVARDSAARFGVTAEFALRYFTKYISYHFGKEELAGWNAFGELCLKHRLITKVPEFRQFRET
jgi:chorismate dehydratase